MHSEFRYVDFQYRGRHTTKWQRIPTQEIQAYRQKYHNADVFTTIQRFRNAERTEREHQYSPFFFDFDTEDKSNLTLTNVMQDAKKTIDFFSDPLNVGKADIRLWFSGRRGIHVLINPVALGIEPHPELTYIIKQAALDLAKTLNLPTLDRTVYTIRRQFRLTDSYHSGGEAYKVELDPAELLLSEQEIRKIAQHPRGRLYDSSEYEDAEPAAEAMLWWREHVEEYEAEKRRKKPGKTVQIINTETTPVCVQDLLNNHIRHSGTQNQATMALATYCKDIGKNAEETEAILTPWITTTPRDLTTKKTDRELIANLKSVIRSVYADNKYRFGCAFIKALGTEDDPLTCAGTDCNVVEGQYSTRRTATNLGPDPDWKEPKRVSIDEAREILRSELEKVQDHPDEKVHLFTYPMGTGKTHAAAEVFEGAHVLWLSQQHEQLHKPVEVLTERGIADFIKLHQLNERYCEHMAPIWVLMELGHNYRKLICEGQCNESYRCEYFGQFQEAAYRRVLLAPMVYLRNPNFFTEYGNKRRNFIIFDEDVLPFLKEQRIIDIRDLDDYLLAINSRAEDRILARHIELGNWISEIAKTELFRNGSLFSVPENLRFEKNPNEEEATELILAIAQEVIQEQPAIIRDMFVNYFDDLQQLLTNPTVKPYGIGRSLSFIRERHIPQNKTVVCLDATGQKEVLERAIGREVLEHRCPEIAHQSRLIQVMDKNWSRRQMKDGRKASQTSGDAPRIARIIDAILEVELDRHDTFRPTVGLVCFKDYRNDILKHSRNKDLFDESRVAWFHAQRGRNRVESDILFVVGSPKTNEADRRRLALALSDGQIDFEDLHLVERTVPGRDLWKVRSMYYDNLAMRLVYDYTVTAELIQAIGRSRYLLRPATVYILTNEPIPLDVERVFLSDLARIGRKDSKKADYFAAANRLLDEGKGVNNTLVSQTIGIHRNSGAEYFQEFVESYIDSLRKVGHNYFAIE